MLAAVLLGAALGLAANAAAGDAPWLAWVVASLAQPVGQLFLRLLMMLVVPLLFAALVLGLCDLDLRELGRMGARMLGYTVAVSTIAVLIGMALVNLVGPGRGLPDEVRSRAPPPRRRRAPPPCRRSSWRSCPRTRSRPPPAATSSASSSSRSSSGWRSP
jgi:Na+/H+-dicarboxylate symporter